MENEVMKNAWYMLAAFAVAWAGVFAYVLFLSVRQARLSQEIDALKSGLKEKGAGELG